MLIAYLTTDEVNEQLALHMAEEIGQTLCILSPSDAPPEDEFDAAVYDWDYLPLQRQQALQAQLLAGQGLRPAAVHGYNLDDDCVQALRRQNVAVHRTLRPEVFQRLAREYKRLRAAHSAAFGAEKEPPSRNACLVA